MENSGGALCRRNSAYWRGFPKPSRLRQDNDGIDTKQVRLRAPWSVMRRPGSRRYLYAVAGSEQLRCKPETRYGQSAPGLGRKNCGRFLALVFMCLYTYLGSNKIQMPYEQNAADEPRCAEGGATAVHIHLICDEGWARHRVRYYAALRVLSLWTSKMYIRSSWSGLASSD